MTNGQSPGVDECYNCGCNLKKACPDYEGEAQVSAGNKVRVHRVRGNAILPERAHPTDAGADLRYAPEGLSTIIPLNIAPAERALVPTGLRIEVPEGYMLEIKNKSGLSLKKGLQVGGGVVDQGYTGEVKVILHNIGSNIVTIDPGQKIAQAVFVKITTDIEFVEQEQIYDNETSLERQAGGFGSTGD